MSKDQVMSSSSSTHTHTHTHMHTKLMLLPLPVLSELSSIFTRTKRKASGDLLATVNAAVEDDRELNEAVAASASCLNMDLLDDSVIDPQLLNIADIVSGTGQ